MAKQNDRQFTVQDKCRYYEKRVNNPHLSDGQRRYAQKRLNSLCGGGKSKSVQKNTSSGNFTAAQTAAFNAGIGYGAAKAGVRVPVREENKQSFRAGLERGKAIRQ